VTFDDLAACAKEVLDLRPDGWTKDPLFDLAKLTEEAGEVAQCMVKSSKTKEDLGEELSDVLVVVGMIALRAGIDLNEAFPKKRAKGVQKLLKRFHNGAYPPHVKRGLTNTT
jgi:NTP pyrophosphatase (non-canonical NTP hydrolase)